MKNNEVSMTKMGISILVGIVCWFCINVSCSIPQETTPVQLLTLDLSQVKSFELVCPTTTDDEIVLWYKRNPATLQDEELQYSQRYIFSAFNKVQLLNLEVRDKGTYKCKSAMTMNVLRAFELNVIDSSLIRKVVTKAPVWTHLPDLKTTVYNKRATILPCRAKGKNVEVKAYRIFPNGTEIRLRGSGVIIHRTKGSDSGRYKCEATNQGGTRVHTFRIVVRVNGGFSTWSTWSACSSNCGFGMKKRSRTCNKPAPANGGMNCYGRKVERRRCKRSCLAPKLVKFGYDITTGDLVLICVAKGIPMPTVQWKFEGYSLGGRYGSSTGRAVIPKNKARPGTYSCTVRNDVGYFTTDIPIAM